MRRLTAFQTGRDVRRPACAMLRVVLIGLLALMTFSSPARADDDNKYGYNAEEYGVSGSASQANSNRKAAAPNSWTPWLSRDTPEGKGDEEKYDDFQPAPCPSDTAPVGVQCRRKSDKVAWMHTELKNWYECDMPKTRGGRCLKEQARSSKVVGGNIVHVVWHIICHYNDHKHVGAVDVVT